MARARGDTPHNKSETLAVRDRSRPVYGARQGTRGRLSSSVASARREAGSAGVLYLPFE